MPIQEFIDIEETVLFCQKMASQLYATRISNGWSLDDDESFIRDLTEKKRVKLTLELSDIFCDFIINPSEKIQESTVAMRHAAISDEVEYLKAITVSEENNAEDLENVSYIDFDDIDDMMKPSSLRKRLVCRIQQTQERIQKFSNQPNPKSASKPKP